MANWRESLIEYSTPWGKIITKLNREFLEYIQDKWEKSFPCLLPRELLPALCAGLFSYTVTSQNFFETKLHLGKSSSSEEWEVEGIGQLKGMADKHSSLLFKVRAALHPPEQPRAPLHASLLSFCLSLLLTSAANGANGFEMKTKNFLHHILLLHLISQASQWTRPTKGASLSNKKKSILKKGIWRVYELLFFREVPHSSVSLETAPWCKTGLFLWHLQVSNRSQEPSAVPSPLLLSPLPSRYPLSSPAVPSLSCHSSLSQLAAVPSPGAKLVTADTKLFDTRAPRQCQIFLRDHKNPGDRKE